MVIKPRGAGRPVIREPGKYNIPNDAYHADKDYFSSSQLKEAFISPAHFKYFVLDRNGKNKSTKSMERGTLVHTCILEPHKMDEEYIVYNGDLTPTGLIPAGSVKNHDRDFPNHTLITPAEYAFAQKARKNCEDYPAVKELLFNDTVEYEPSYFLKDSDTGLPLRVRPDAISVDKGYIIDLKTTRAKNKKDFCNDAFYNFHYDLSMYMYLYCLYQITGREFEWYFLTVSTDDTCSVALYKVSLSTKEKGKAKFFKAIEGVRDALAMPDKFRFQMEPEEI